MLSVSRLIVVLEGDFVVLTKNAQYFFLIMVFLLLVSLLIVVNYI